MKHIFLGILVLISSSSALSAQRSEEEALRRAKENSRRQEARLDNDPFVGITTNGKTESGLFKIESTRVSTKSIQKAAKRFISTLSESQKKETLFAVDDDEWRKWMNQHFYDRAGMGFEDMNESQKEAAFGLLKASLSAKGFKLSRDIMRLNHTLGEMQGSMFMLGEWAYWITIMGEPSATEPWGWQIDGHHLIINFFVLGDQVVATPTFIGSEPVIAESGKYAGIEILQDEQNQALAFAQSLTSKQKSHAILSTQKPGNDNETEAFKDNVVLPYEGLPVSHLDAEQATALQSLVALFIDSIREPHAKIRMEEILKHWDDTYFAWKGSTDEDAVFYYRIHSPVVLIEFDHQNPIGLRRQFPNRAPIRQHVHAVVRTPNGNDYGKDLLRQHYEQYTH
ncbi:MAG: DUF3500 domain-containing protein [Verrucomicrobia bacterium]|nr:DUF3500 domain-containing protein [Verrucomicrobiota bacterium]